MKSSDLYLSAKFADYLRNIGMLEALVNALKIYRERENYVFQLQDMRIIKQSVFKGLCEFYASQGFNKEVDIEKILQETEEVAKRLYGERPKSVSEEITTEIKKRKVQKRKKAKAEEEPKEELLPED